MADKTIPEMTTGGNAQNGDLVPAFRSGAPDEDVNVALGTMASEDAADYLDEADTEALVNTNPTVVPISSTTTLTDADHNGAEIILRPQTGSPSGYFVDVPYALAVGFRCSFINLCDPGEVIIRLATGSPNDSLNGIEGGSAEFAVSYSGAYLRKPAAGELIIVGGGILVS